MSDQLSTLLAMMAPSVWGAPGKMTSGRRTHLGNKKVGGVPDSRHVRGDAADFVGATPDELRRYFGAGVKVIPESDHNHVQGLGDGAVPYYGNRGTAGLVNGVDTSAPKTNYAGFGGLKAAKPDMQQRASQFSVDLPPAPQGSLAPSLRGPMPQVAPVQDQTAGIASALQDNAATGDKKARKGELVRTIIGALSDGLLAYSGGQPMFAPLNARNMENEEARNFDREKWSAELAAKREAALAKAQEPPEFIQKLDAFQKMPREQQSAYLQFLDMTQPIAVSGPMGTQRVPRSMSGPPPQAISELRSAIAKGDMAAVAEFEEVFGQGSASSFLGQ